MSPRRRASCPGSNLHLLTLVLLQDVVRAHAHQDVLVHQEEESLLGLSCVSSSYLDQLAQVDVIRYKELGFVSDRQLPLTLVWLYHPQDLRGVLLSDELDIFHSLLESSTLLEGYLQPQGARVRLGGPASCNCHFSGFFECFACMFAWEPHTCSVCGDQKGAPDSLSL